MRSAALVEKTNCRCRIAPESLVLAAICLLDLVTTVFWVTYRNALEGNPLMAYYLQWGGTPAFIGAKIVLCVFPLFIAEWARRTRPQFVLASLRFGIVAYITLYGMGVAHVNRAEAQQIDEDSLSQIADSGEETAPAGVLLEL